MSFCCVISFYHFKSYRISGFAYLLELLMGFAILGVSFAFQHLSSKKMENKSVPLLMFYMVKNDLDKEDK
jgi:lipid-A-disaccharide synthase-like uncharacterized protein